jgi:8-oxo-dGTP pyrophosphatase MutT (NUDIX family)
MENPWKTLRSRVVYDNPWIRVREDDVIRPDGAPGIYGVVTYKNRAIGVLPVEDNGDLWLVGQYRYALAQYSWEIPEGGGTPEESDESCARRELAEETGFTADQLEPLVTSHLSNAVSDEWGIIFRATGLQPGPSNPEGCERIELKRVSLDDALAMVRRGEITDSLSVIAILHEALQRATRPPQPVRLQIDVLPESFAIIPANAANFPKAWADGTGFHAIIRSSEGTTVVSDQSRIPPETKADRDWRALQLRGPFDLNAIGILSRVSAALAEAQVPLFAISTYETDVILVRDASLDRAVRALQNNGCSVAMP